MNVLSCIPDSSRMWETLHLDSKSPNSSSWDRCGICVGLRQGRTLGWPDMFVIERMRGDAGIRQQYEEIDTVLNVLAAADYGPLLRSMVAAATQVPTSTKAPWALGSSLVRIPAIALSKLGGRQSAAVTYPLPQSPMPRKQRLDNWLTGHVVKTALESLNDSIFAT
jgi:hypothetical protein